jgi:lysophospholipase L1-like esterase
MTVSRIVLIACLPVSLVLGVVAGGAFGFHRWRQSPSAAFHQTESIVLARAGDVAPGGIVVLGDSIVEQQQIDRLCGLPVLNASISGARIGHYIDLMPKVLTLARPSRVVVALGTNDLRGRKPTSGTQFKQQLQQVLAEAGPRPIVVGVAGPQAESLNNLLAAAARAHGGVFVEPPPASLTTDGVHLSADGKRDWRRRVEAACD